MVTVNYLILFVSWRTAASRPLCRHHGRGSISNSSRHTRRKRRRHLPHLWSRRRWNLTKNVPCQRAGWLFGGLARNTSKKAPYQFRYHLDSFSVFQAVGYAMFWCCSRCCTLMHDAALACFGQIVGSRIAPSKHQQAFCRQRVSLRRNAEGFMLAILSVSSETQGLLRPTQTFHTWKVRCQLFPIHFQALSGVAPLTPEQWRLPHLAPEAPWSSSVPSWPRAARRRTGGRTTSGWSTASLYHGALETENGWMDGSPDF